MKKCKKVMSVYGRENEELILLEFGNGFAFVGRQYHLEIEREDYYIDYSYIGIILIYFFII